MDDYDYTNDDKKNYSDEEELSSDEDETINDEDLKDQITSKISGMYNQLLIFEEENFEKQFFQKLKFEDFEKFTLKFYDLQDLFTD